MRELDLGTPNPKQELFLRSRARFTAYGGARGGGKSWVARVKAELMALRYPGIRILILRRSFPELRENHIRPLRSLCRGVARYKDSDKTLTFANGSVILFGYCASESDVLQYQGQEYDVIIMDEATQFTEYQFQTLTASLRGANSFPKRFYLTCNPGGVGHAWVKRLFVDRDFKGSENPEDYVFIQAKVTDNPNLMEQDPGYVRMLDNLPPGLREAWRDGNWDVFAGQYFTEWDREVHVCAPFEIPEWWRRYVTLDYGLDMLAAYLIAVDDRGMAYVLREVYEGKDLGEGAVGLNIHDAAERVRTLMAGERVTAVLAPPDLWAKQRESGKTTADLFAEHGVYLTKASADRVAGWLAVKEWLRPFPDGEGGRTAKLRIFPRCVNLIRTLPLLQYDEKKPSDASGEPHELTHAPDAIRYFCASWTLGGEMPEEAYDEDMPGTVDHGDYLAGGEPGEDYLNFGG